MTTAHRICVVVSSAVQNENFMLVAAAAAGTNGSMVGVFRTTVIAISIYRIIACRCG